MFLDIPYNAFKHNVKDLTDIPFICHSLERDLPAPELSYIFQPLGSHSPNDICTAFSFRWYACLRIVELDLLKESSKLSIESFITSGFIWQARSVMDDKWDKTIGIDLLRLVIPFIMYHSSIQHRLWLISINGTSPITDQLDLLP